MTNKIIYKYTFILFLVASLTSCLDYDELRENPNSPNSVPPSLIFTDLTPGVTNSFGDTYTRAQYHLWSATDGASAPNFNSGFGGSFGGYSAMRNIIKMNEAADVANAPIYIIMGKFYQARAFLEMTRTMGDIPLTESVMGADNPTPKYDTQKSVYIQGLDWLDEVSLELNSFISQNPGYVLEGDPYFGGDLQNWQKVINAYTIRILVTLSKKENDAEVNVKGRFSKIINNPDTYPLMESLADNAELASSNEDGFKQTYNPDQAVYKASVVYASTYIDMLKGTEDPRLMVVADPTKDALEADPGNETGVRADFDSYTGADISINGTVISAAKLDGDFSFPNEEKYWNFVGQPGIWLGYSEQEFSIAEAANRGWITADAKTHYDNGVRASMEWYGVDEDLATNFINISQPYVAGAAGLTRILEQKYVSFAENSGQESFFTTRRTGVPTYLFSSENGIDDGDGYPVRYTYPGSEEDDNHDNYRAALNAQFGAEVDDRDGIIWLLQD